MKSSYELKYEELIFSLILAYEKTKDRQIQLLLDFHQNGEEYYEALCDAAYELSVGRRTKALCISLSGKPFFSENDSTGEGFVLCYPAEIPVFEEDLMEQLEFLLSQLQKLTQFSKCG